MSSILVIDDDNDVVEVPASTPARSSTRQQSSRYSLFVTPGPDEVRTTGTPATRRSTSALHARRASSAPRVHASSPHISNSPCIDLTLLDDSDEEAENGDDDVAGASPECKEEGESVQPEEDTTNGADEAADGVPAQLNLGIKRTRLTSPASEGGGESNKRQKSNEVRTGSLPLTLPAQTWSWPRDV